MSNLFEKVRVGIVGCGNVSALYLSTLAEHPLIDILSCADIDISRSTSLAEAYGIPQVDSVTGLIENEAIELVVNLTPPQVHGEIGMQVVQAGKALYSEKPLAATFPEAWQILEAAKQHGVLVGAAPDTTLGGGLQTCRKLLDDGWIGTPIAATAFMMCHGHESWHPEPHFYYRDGGGPLFDMGPYYLSALVTLLGPVESVASATRISFPEREALDRNKRKYVIPVEIATHIAAVLQFATGPIATLVTSFDVWAASVPHIEIYGSKGTLHLPDPNTYGGPIKLQLSDESDWNNMPLLFAPCQESRGLGVIDMAHALRTNSVPRVSGELALHVVEIMNGILLSGSEGRHISLTTSVAGPEAVPRPVD